MNDTRSGELKSGAITIAAFVAIFWAEEIVDQLFFSGGLDTLGVWPRSFDHIWGVLLMPFLHGGFAHLSANTLPFAVLGMLIAVRGKAQFWETTIFVTIVGGLGVWLVGSEHSVHIGASGLIFGYFGFLLAVGIFERKLGSILISVVVGLLYGSMIWGVLPRDPRISWEGHLFGFLAGVVAAKLLAGDKKKS